MMPGDDATKVRMLEHRGEAYLNRSDLLEVVRVMAHGLVNPHDQALAEHIVRWLSDATRSEP